MSELGAGGQRVQTSKRYVSPSDVMYSMVTTVNHTLLKKNAEYLKVARVASKSSHHKENTV